MKERGWRRGGGGRRSGRPFSSILKSSPSGALAFRLSARASSRDAMSSRIAASRAPARAGCGRDRERRCCCRGGEGAETDACSRRAATAEESRRLAHPLAAEQEDATALAAALLTTVTGRIRRTRSRCAIRWYYSFSSRAKKEEEREACGKKIVISPLASFDLDLFFSLSSILLSTSPFSNFLVPDPLGRHPLGSGEHLAAACFLFHLLCFD